MTDQLECVGVDVFVWSKGGIPKIPTEVAGLKMDCISQRGLKCSPGPTPEGLIVDWYVCRYTSQTSASDESIQKLLSEISKQMKWEKVQKLFRQNNVDLFSKVYEA